MEEVGDSSVPNGAEEATNELQKCLRKWKHNVAFSSDGNSSYEDGNEIDDSSWVQILEELCLKGADLHYLERERGFALIPHVFYSEKLIQFFVNRGLDLNSSRDENGDTALHLAIRHVYRGLTSKIERPKRNLLNLLKFLLFEQSAATGVANYSGETAITTLANDCDLLFECENKWTTKLVKMLMDVIRANSIDVSNQLFIDHVIIDGNFRTPSWTYSKTPLMFAAEKGNLDYVRHLVLQRGAFVNDTDLQGYTALHYAVSNGALDCAEFLIQMGRADSNVKSVSGKTAYDLSVAGCNPFTYGKLVGMTVSKMVEMYEISRARAIITNNPGRPNREMYQSAMNTVARLSQTETSKFWNLLAYASYPCQEDISQYITECDRIFDFIHVYLSEYLKGPDQLASFDVADIKSLSWLVRCIDYFLFQCPGVQWQVTFERISSILSIARLAFDCFKKLINATNSKIVSDDCVVMYGDICHTLTSLHYHLQYHPHYDVIMSETTASDNELLLKNFIDLDLRNKDGDSLLHLIHNQKYRHWLIMDFMVLLDFNAKVTTRNKMGFEPAQCVKDWERFEDEDLVKFADRGAHVDARNAYDGKTLREELKERYNSNAWFRYDTLKCACARVLALSLVPYRNWVPKKIVHFIHEH